MIDYVMARDGSWHYVEVDDDHHEVMEMLKRILAILVRLEKQLGARPGEAATPEGGGR